MNRHLRLILSTVAAVAATYASAQRIMISPVPIFGNASVINPVVCDSVLYFASDKKNDVLVNYFNANGDRLYQLYKVPLHHKQPYGEPQSYFTYSNRPYNQIAITFDAAKKAYVTQNDANQPTRNGDALGIFEYGSPALTNDGYPVMQMPKGSNAAYPSYSPDGKLMVFASDMPGGEGQSDLYYRELIDGQWTRPQNMGSNVNTRGAEITPFIHPSGKIFFASNGRSDSRKLDIYYTFKTPDGFAKPVRFDIVVNSIGDDYGIYISDNEEWGFITSNRHGIDQLYYFCQEFPVFPDADEMIIENYCFTFFESSAENYDPSEFGFRWTFSDGFVADGLETDHCFDGPGDYHISLSVLDKTSGEELFTIAEYDMPLVRPHQININFPEEIFAGESVIFSADPSLITDFTPTTYYWDFGRGLRVKGKSAAVTFDKPGTYRVKCGTIADEDPDIKLCTWVDIEVKEK